jgi:hypothetical protein
MLSILDYSSKNEEIMWAVMWRIHIFSPQQKVIFYGQFQACWDVSNG